MFSTCSTLSGSSWRGQADAGVGDEQVDRPELIAQRMDGGHGLLAVGDVGRGDGRGASGGADLLGQLLELVLPAGQQSDPAAPARQLLGQGPAQPAGRAGDDGDLVGERHRILTKFQVWRLSQVSL